MALWCFCKRKVPGKRENDVVSRVLHLSSRHRRAFLFLCVLGLVPPSCSVPPVTGPTCPALLFIKLTIMEDKAPSPPQEQTVSLQRLPSSVRLSLFMHKTPGLNDAARCRRLFLFILLWVISADAVQMFQLCQLREKRVLMPKCPREGKKIVAVKKILL